MGSRHLSSVVSPVASLAMILVMILAIAAPAVGAVVASREVELRIEGPVFLQREVLTIRLEEKADLEAWRRYPISLDEHITLEDSRAEVLDAAGKVLRSVPRRRFEEVQSPGWELHSSRRVLLVPFEDLQVGQLLRLDITLRHRPPFPAATVVLDLDQKQEQLRVRVGRGAPGLRWHLRGSEERFRPRFTEGQLEWVAEGLAAFREEPFSPAAGSLRPALFLGWGNPQEWADVGRWYEGFTADLPRTASTVAALARELTAGLVTPREKVEVLAAYVKQKVRYEAVEIGEGGWRPTPSAQTLARGWGDCKDKSELLVELLAQVGIPGYLALVRAGFGESIETGFPSALQFNHAIVAVAASAAGAGGEDPVAEDFLFIDPTVDRGAVGWLSPFAGGRPVLVVDGARSRLVETPMAEHQESRTLEVRGEVDGTGTLRGSLDLRYTGERAASWIREGALTDRDRVLESFQRVVHAVLPGAVLEQVQWRELEAAVPTFELHSELRLADAVRGEAGQRWLRLEGWSPLPEPRHLEARTVPVSLRPGRYETRWALKLPAGWCPPVATETRVENAVGAVTASIRAGEEAALVVERRVEIRRSRIEGPAQEELAALATEDFRSRRRRVLLRCGEGNGS